MSNFSPKLEDAKDSELMYMVNEFDVRMIGPASDELTRRTIKKLEKTIEIFNEQSSKSTDKLVRLTWWIVGLTVVMVLGLIIQIFSAL